MAKFTLTQTAARVQTLLNAVETLDQSVKNELINANILVREVLDEWITLFDNQYPEIENNNAELQKLNIGNGQGFCKKQQVGSPLIVGTAAPAANVYKIPYHLGSAMIKVTINYWATPPMVYSLLDSNDKVLISHDLTSLGHQTNETFTINCEIPKEIEDKCAFIVFNSFAKWGTQKAQQQRVSENYTFNDKVVKDSPDFHKDNVLYGKKLITCGDSITQGIDCPKDPVHNQVLTYGLNCALRNSMIFENRGISGSTMMVTNPSEPTVKNPFSYQRYKDIPTDTDYLTIFFGWNDTAYGNGRWGDKNSQDNTTYWGAYKIVLDYLVKNLPNTHIGIIVPFGCNETIRNAVRELSKMYGVGCFDIPGDPNIPVIYEKEPSFGMTEDMKAFYKTKYMANGAHPNLDGHLRLSYAFEAWLRTL